MVREVCRDDIHQHGARDALPVEAMVAEETIVFGSDEGVADGLRYLVVLHGATPLGTDLCDQLVLTRIDAQWHLQLDRLHGRCRRQRRLHVDVAAGDAVRRQDCDRDHTECTC